MTDAHPFQLPLLPRRPAIAVCGSSADHPNLNALAEAVGRRIAESGALLVCGGRGGVMAAACKGAVEAGGLTIGILPGDDPRAANPYAQVVIATGMGHARNVIIVQTAAAVIAIGGEFGTLSEIALARKCGRPVVALHSWELGTDAANTPYLIHVHTPDEAVRKALAAVTEP
jgi:uncharacterized protein (TIGR00725 family)